MRIAMIGGLDRNEELLLDLAERAGHALEVHHGRLAGRGSDGVRALIERADVVVFTPDVNSHGATQLCKRLARERGVPFVVLRTCGVSRFRAFLDGLRQAA